TLGPPRPSRPVEGGMQGDLEAGAQAAAAVPARETRRRWASVRATVRRPHHRTDGVPPPDTRTATTDQGRSDGGSARWLRRADGGSCWAPGRPASRWGWAPRAWRRPSPTAPA